MTASTPCTSIARSIAAALVASIASCVPFAGALAHPDIRIDDQVTFLFHGAEIIAIAETWTFDPAYSKAMLTEYNRAHDGHLSPAESRNLAEHTLPNLAEIRYFNFAALDGADLGALALRDFVATAENGRVTFSFVLDLPKPFDPRRRKIALEIVDRDYYAAFQLLEKDPVRLRDPEGVTCASHIRDDVEHPYFGFVYPQEITLSCR